MFQVRSEEESNGIDDGDEVEKKKSTPATDCEVAKGLTVKETSEEMQPAQDNELAQTSDTEGAETVGDKLAELNGIADKDEVEKKKSTRSTDSEELTLNKCSQLWMRN